ncbi:GTP-binding protein [Pseudooceanicola sp. CBS1P-1]|nr:GTP-binding protein [Pseudooceanicola endophyticus]
MTPVILLTGFLGSGKTTLLQRLLDDPSMAGAAVLINEFGEVALDHHLLDRIDDTVVLLKSGCICCTVRGEVADALLNLESLRARAEIAFDRVVIETTGLADPYPVLQTLTAHPVLRSHFAHGGVLTTVDAVNAGRQVDHRAEAVRQIAAADRIVLTKTDLAPPGTEAALRDRLGRINPTAGLVTSADPVPAILADFGPALLPAPREGGHDAAHVCDATCNHDHGHDHGHHHHHHPGADTLGVTSFSLVIADAIDWTMFGTWLTLLLHKYGDKIFRVKGILVIEGEDRPVAIHGVQHLIHAPTHLDHWPEGPRQSRLVFILEGVSPDLIRRSFAAFTGLQEVRTAA